jgi:DNA repair exonuclease SbcCD ATPase subunit
VQDAFGRLFGLGSIGKPEGFGPPVAKGGSVRRLAAIALAAVAIAAGCSAGGGDGSSESLEADVATLEKANALLEQRIAELEKLTGGEAGVSNSVDALEEWAIGFQSKQLRWQRQQSKALAAVKESLETLEEELGEQTESGATLTEISKTVKALRRDLNLVSDTADLALQEAQAALATAGSPAPPPVTTEQTP